MEADCAAKLVREIRRAYLMLGAEPEDERVTLHTNAPAPDHRARRTEPPTRHVSTPADSDDDENPPPSTVSGVPPSDDATDGDTQLTDAASWYMNLILSFVYCWPFNVTCSSCTPTLLIGDVHSI